MVIKFYSQQSAVMGSLGNPKTWIPYMNTKDSSQGFCSIYCPQWCYIIFPPPPPIEFPEDNSNPTFSPLVIAIIGILASAFLLVTYYIIISKYCRNRDTTARRQNNGLNVELEDNHNPSLHEPWHVATAGLDEALIKSIAVCKYKKGDGMVEGTDCPVCLSEFEEDENLRLLPKCSHAFHVQCIDTWLKSHSNCPLCRANIVSFHAPPPEQSPFPVTETAPDENVDTAQNLERVGGEIELEMVQNEVVPKTPFRAFSDLGNLEDRGTVIDIRDEDHQHIRRSFSMNFSCQGRVSGADEDVQGEDGEFQGDAGAGPSRKWAAGDDQVRKCRNNRKGVLNSVMSPVAMKRSFSSGRFLFIGHGRVRNAFIPV